jgi:hypothetical protein
MKNTVHRLMGCLLAILPVLCGAQSKGFTNPLLPSGADPFVVYHQGYYYYTHTLGNRIQLWKTQHIGRLGNAVSKTVWTAPQEGPDSRDLWAPELHRFNNKWYLYYTATDKARPADSTRFIFVLENEAADPLEGNWVRKGKVNTAYSGLDATVFTWKAQPYFAYSAYVGKQSVLCLAAMSNPWTLTGKETIIARPDRPWEKFGGREILEAPAFLEGKKDSCCWCIPPVPAGQMNMHLVCWKQPKMPIYWMRLPGKNTRSRCSGSRRRTACSPQATMHSLLLPTEKKTGCFTMPMQKQGRGATGTARRAHSPSGGMQTARRILASQFLPVKFCPNLPVKHRKKPPLLLLILRCNGRQQHW